MYVVLFQRYVCYAVPIDSSDLSVMQTALIDMECKKGCVLENLDSGYDCSTTMIDAPLNCNETGHIVSMYVWICFNKKKKICSKETRFFSYMEKQPLTGQLSSSLALLPALTRLHIVCIDRLFFSNKNKVSVTNFEYLNTHFTIFLQRDCQDMRGTIPNEIFARKLPKIRLDKNSTLVQFFCFFRKWKFLMFPKNMR